MGESTSHVFLLGCRASGKTSFLCGLGTLTRGGSDSPFQLVVKDGPTARVLTDLRALAERQNWPPPTSSMTPLTFELSYKSRCGERRYEISLLDYPGEDLLEAMETLNFEDRRPLEEQFKRADYVLVAADPTQDLITPVATDPKAVRRRQDALVQAIGQLIKRRTSTNVEKARRPPELAILITKADLLAGDKAASAKAIKCDNRAFLKNLGRLSASTSKCFRISSCGTTAMGTDGKPIPPEKPEPAGYELLFDWLSQRHFLATHRKMLQSVGGIGAILLLLFMGYLFWSHQREATLITTIGSGSIQEVHNAVVETGELTPLLKEVLDQRMEAELKRIDNALNGGPTGDHLMELADQAKLLMSIPGSAHSRELEATRDRINQRRDDSLFGAIEVARRSGTSEQVLKYIAEYRHAFPSGIHRDEIESCYTKIVGERRAGARGRVRGSLVTNRGSLASKAKKIRNYLKSYQDDEDAPDMLRAAAIAEGLATCDKLRLRMKGCGFAPEKGERDHQIRWIINGKDLDVLRFTSDGERTESTIDKSSDVSFADWTRITIEMWDLDLVNEKMATAGVDLLRDLAKFDGKNHFSLPDDAPGYWDGVNAYVIIEVQWRKDQGWSALPPRDLQAYGRFIQPGRDW